MGDEGAEKKSPSPGPSSPKKGSSSGVKVMVRVRPFNSREKGISADRGEALQCVVSMEGQNCIILNHQKEYEPHDAYSAFVFDECLWSLPEDEHNPMSENGLATQQTVYEKGGLEALSNAWEGYNTCIFAYGQTGAGKSFSMLGAPVPGLEGISPRLIRDLFKHIDAEKEDRPQTVYTVNCTFFEIYMEKVKDLFTKGKSGEYAAVKIRQHPVYGIQVHGLETVKVDSEKECSEKMDYGVSQRSLASTKMNATSSRSHAIFQIHIGVNDVKTKTKTQATINLVDLAGSERLGKTGATGQTKEEGMAINLSLSTLRKVMDALVDNAKGKKTVPPYRESMLTWVLKESLGGNSKTVMITAISPHYDNLEDTISTLRYGLKAKAIVNKVVKQETTANKQLKQCQERIDELMAQLQRAQEDGGEGAKEIREELETAQQHTVQLEEEMKEVEVKAKHLEYETMHLKRRAFAAAFKSAFRHKEEKGQLTEARSRVEELETRVEEADRELMGANERVLSVTLEVNRVIEELKEVRTEKEEVLKEQEMERQEHAAAIQRVKEEAVEECGALRKVVEEEKAKGADDLRQRQEALEAEAARAAQERDDLRTRLACAEQQAETGERECDRLTQAWAAEKKDLQAESERRAERIEEEFGRARQRLEDRLADVERSRLQDEEKSAARIRGLEEEGMEVRGELQLVQGRHAEAERKVSELKAKLSQSAHESVAAGRKAEADLSDVRGELATERDMRERDAARSELALKAAEDRAEDAVANMRRQMEEAEHRAATLLEAQQHQAGTDLASAAARERDLDTALAESKAAVADLEGRLKASEEFGKEAARTVEELEHSVRRESARTDAAAESTRHAESRCQQLRETCTKLEGSLEAVRKELRDTREAGATRQREEQLHREKLETTCRELNEEVSLLNQHADEIAEALAAEKAAHKDRSVSAAKKEEAMTSAIETLERKVKQMTETAEDSRIAAVHSQEAAVAQCEADAERTRLAYEDKLHQQVSASKRLEEQLTDMTGLRDTQSAAREQAESKARELEGSLARAVTRTQVLETSLKSRDGDVAELKHDLQAVCAARDGFSSSLDEEERARKVAERALASAEQKVRLLNERIKPLEEQRERRAVQLREMQEENQRLAATAREDARLRREAESKAAAMKAAIAPAEARIQELEERRAGLERQLQNAGTDAESQKQKLGALLWRQKSEMQSVLVELQKEKESATGRCAATAAAAQKDATDSSNRVAELERKNGELERELAHCQQKLRAVDGRVHKALTDDEFLQGYVARLEEQLKEKGRELPEARRGRDAAALSAEQLRSKHGFAETDLAAERRVRQRAWRKARGLLGEIRSHDEAAGARERRARRVLDLCGAEMRRKGDSDDQEPVQLGMSAAERAALAQVTVQLVDLLTPAVELDDQSPSPQRGRSARASLSPCSDAYGRLQGIYEAGSVSVRARASSVATSGSPRKSIVLDTPPPSGRTRGDTLRHPDVTSPLSGGSSGGEPRTAFVSQRSKRVEITSPGSGPTSSRSHFDAARVASPPRRYSPPHRYNGRRTASPRSGHPSLTRALAGESLPRSDAAGVSRAERSPRRVPETSPRRDMSPSRSGRHREYYAQPAPPRFGYDAPTRSV